MYYHIQYKTLHLLTIYNIKFLNFQRTALINRIEEIE